MRRRLVVLALTLTTLAGCGNEPTPAPPAPAVPPVTTAPLVDEAPALPDACELIKQADAEKLAGTPLDPPLPVKDTCTYTGPVTGPTAQVEVYVGDGAKKFLDIDRELGHAFTELAGIGDEAHLEDGTVFFAKGGVWVSIRLVRLVDPAETRDPLEAAARTAAGRM
ncbi:hypothetical protein SAMN05421812_10436 [Asanoa hainanensis]|uniref:DUF3558 domain-containing protein n=1 Tax=Asanoa hainanensis TaxID=560556 RepID=A0A239L466_9ACTN|nr:hypothetical protein [Asanoa hainanensis]SNT25397.1 hypothetical protein SAMN05421812_10436 [Asanoa hainanensis]